MRLLFSGGTICETPTFKRLLITAEEIGFMDRPSVTFANWGTIGHDSEARGLLRAFEGKPVSVTVHAPPSGPVRHAYLQYIRADLANPDFRAIFLRGLAESLTFAAKFVQADADYGSGKAREVIAALLADTQVATVPLRPAREAQRLFQVDDDVARRDTLRVLLTEASIHVTNAMVVGAATGLIPVTDDPFLAQLLWLRSSSPTYVGGTAAAAPLLALEISRAVIPDRTSRPSSDTARRPS